MTSLQTDLYFFKTDPNIECAYGTRIPLAHGVKACFLYRKSADSAETGAKNQDALAWRVSESGEIISFAVSDGVSGSFVGYVASNLLAGMLVEYLSAWAQSSSTQKYMSSEDFRQHLDEWVHEGRKRLEAEAAEVRAVTNPVLVEILKARQSRGSDSVLFCGCLDLRPGAQSLFAWLGNVRGQAFGPDGGELLDLLTMQDDRERWTTSRGSVGVPHVEFLPTSSIRRVAVSSDGLAEVAQQLAGIRTIDEETELVRSLSAQAVDDDVSLLTLWLPAVEARATLVSLAASPEFDPGPKGALETTVETSVQNDDSSTLASINTEEENLPLWTPERRFRFWHRVSAALLYPFRH